MALTDTFVKKAKDNGEHADDKHRNGGGMYLLVNSITTGAAGSATAG